jgi:hypothetical protein
MNTQLTYNYSFNCTSFSGGGAVGGICGAVSTKIQTMREARSFASKLSNSSIKQSMLRNTMAFRCETCPGGYNMIFDNGSLVMYEYAFPEFEITHYRTESIKQNLNLFETATTMIATPNPISTGTGLVIIGSVIATNIAVNYFNDPFPKPWYTDRPNNYVPQQPQGFNPNNFNNGNPNEAVKWFLVGTGSHYLYDTYKQHINSLPPLSTAPQDNTHVQPVFIPRW